MKEKIYFFLITALSLVSLGVFILITFNFDPSKSNFGIKLVFFLSAFIFLSGLLTFPLFYLYRRFFSGIFTKIWVISLRQAASFALFFIGLLVLQALGALTVLDAVLLFIAILIFELYFWSLKTGN